MRRKVKNKNIFDLNKNGWTIIKANNFNKVDKIKNLFFKEIIKNIKKQKIKKDSHIKDFNLLRLRFNKYSHSQINSLKRVYVDSISNKIISAFSKDLIKIFGKNLIVQRFPQIQIHRPKDNIRVTFPHAEIMSSNSPYTYNIWFPLHEVRDNSGLFIIDDHVSVKLCDKEKKMKKKIERIKIIEDYIKFPKLKYGEALLFNAMVYHGSLYHNSKLSRVSMDVRVQCATNPIYEKNNEYFSYLKI